MLEADTAHILGQREQEIIAIIGVAAKQRLCFSHQSGVCREMFLLGFEIFRVIGDDVQMRATGQRMGLKILPGEDRAVDERIIIGFLVDHRAAGSRFRAHRARRLPAIGIDGGRLDRDLADIISGRIERNLVPAQVEHGRCHDNPSLAAGDGRDKLEFCGNLRNAVRYVQMEGEDVDIIADPRQVCAVGGEFQSGDFFDLAARSVIAGQPFRIE